METRNIIAAISLSAAVIILYTLFFAPPPVTQENVAEKSVHFAIIYNSDSKLDYSNIEKQLMDLFKKIPNFIQTKIFSFNNLCLYFNYFKFSIL